MKLFLGAFLFITAGAFAVEPEADLLTVRVTEIPGVKGDLLVGIYDSPESFTDSPMEISPKVELKRLEDQAFVFNDLKPGKYAIAVIQDLNQNGKLDRNFLGMPKEPIAFSVIKKIPKGKPKFEACAFEVGEEPVELVIPLVTK
ncbi:DUF2141 domain-containing protein [Verrucomicrobiales bacterium]|jgi:uncharacterized protein (DUF2141 family)|nr:DUF2141 domain-containing protein [Verrucomicrobiales bacterium]MDA7926549.1 DUF2141 domain-containing protein [Verrucomicrobiales bacterium]|tara:strand:- start:298 stop:729 length:432 start_codon:yes stop_codon:yes gene_type:complete